MVESNAGPYPIEEVVGHSSTDDLVLARTAEGDPLLLRIIRTPLSYETFARDLSWATHVVSGLGQDDILAIRRAEVLGDEKLLLTLDYAEGYTLRKRLAAMREADDRYSEEEALRFIHRLARTLAPALSKGMVHRYLQPHHILVRSDGSPAILGLDMPVRMANELVAASDDEFLVYLSPEQRQGQLLDGRSNIYSLGVLLYEMLTLDAADFTWQPKQPELPPLQEVQPHLAASTYRIVEKCLQPESWARYQTYEALLAALGTTEVVDAAPSPAPKVEKGPAREPRPIFAALPALRQPRTALALLFSLLIVVFVGFALSRSGVTNAPTTDDSMRRMVENESDSNLTASPASLLDDNNGALITSAKEPTAAPIVGTVSATDSAENIASGVTSTPTEAPSATATSVATATATTTSVPPSATPSPTDVPPTATASPTATETVIFVPSPTPLPTETQVPPTPPPTATPTSPPPPPPPPPPEPTSPPPEPTSPPEPSSTPPPPPPPTPTPPPPVAPSPTSEAAPLTTPTAEPSSPPPTPTPTATSILVNVEE